MNPVAPRTGKLIEANFQTRRITEYSANSDLLEQVADSTEERDEVRRILSARVPREWETRQGRVDPDYKPRERMTWVDRGSLASLWVGSAILVIWACMGFSEWMGWWMP